MFPLVKKFIPVTGIAILWIFLAMGCNLNERHAEDVAAAHHIMDSALYLAHSDHHYDPFRFIDSSFAVHSDFGRQAHIEKHICKAHLYYELQNFPLALLQADSALAMLKGEEEHYKKDYTDVIISKGHILVKLKDYNRAFQCLYDSKQFIENEMDTCTYAKFSSAMASVLYLQKKYSEATRYMWEVFEKSGKCDENDYGPAFIERQGSLDNIGLCYENSGKYDSSIMLYKRALNFIDENASKYPNQAISLNICRAVVFGNMGSTYLKMNRLKEAEQYLRLNLEINSQESYESLDEQLTLMKLGHVFIAQKRLDTVAEIIHHLNEKLAARYFIDEDILCRRLTWAYLDAKGDIKNAYAAYRSYKDFSDSIDATNKELPGVDFNRAFYQLKQSNEIAELKRENKFKNLYLAAFILITLMAGIIVYLGYRNYRLYKVNLQRQKLMNEHINKHNSALQHALTALENSQQENTRIMRTVAHDLHNPIAAMVSLADLLNDEMYGQEHNNLVEMMIKSGTDTLKLINNLLHSQPVLAKKLLALDELVSESVSLLQLRADEKEQELVLTKVPVNIIGDREKLWRVVNNLIGNAIKFSNNGQQIHISVAARNGKVLLSVKDNGIGIPDAIKNQLFDLPVSGGRAGTAGEQSFGLGLSICKQIVEAHGGRIWYESEENIGTTFFVELEALPAI